MYTKTKRGSLYVYFIYFLCKKPEYFEKHYTFLRSISVQVTAFFLDVREWQVDGVLK